MVLLLMANIMAYRGSLRNYMAVMVLSFNRILRICVYLRTWGWKSIKLFTFGMVSASMLCSNIYDYVHG